ncbi:malonate decarboxylase holo-[acyl-carrier-protein] synthase [Ramlibacter albus]|uniref:Malonate decarboxylase holo-[acyl-carrier-protein] synthase n=1 Tax=Ramlibacter albus TaxID=2079448 RepID=A0A923M9B7_9BURK|nr:malonate decarboxylase holo-[acyl-carrier-protein] synthase [Ramlibacter albus]MBC5766395.1 malonate decarboxylase holo-[acyl-carrier-protein] synthase [Ramlibacter albus]
MQRRPVTMPALRRHQLAYLSDTGWRHLLAQPFPQDRLDCIALWARERWPLVVTRQQDSPLVSLGLPAPLAFARQRIAVAVPVTSILWLDEFPRASHVLPLLPRKARPHFDALLAGLRAVGALPRAYGSYGWQLLTRQTYLRSTSDLDLLFCVEDEDHADAVAALLGDWPQDLPRIDGEFLFPGGGAVAWREWRQWRSSGARSILVRGLRGATLESEPWTRAYA